MRFHPKSRASTDQRPGPSIARAAAMVPANRPTNGCSATLRICEISITATTVPASGVHSPAKGVEMPRLKTIRPKWAFTVEQATALAAQLPWLLPRTLVGLALLTGLQRGELFALRWRDIDEPNRSLHVRAAVYEGVFDDPKTLAKLETIPLPDAALQLLTAWKARARRTAAHDLTFLMVSGKPISPNNVLRRWVWPACQAADV